MGKATRLYTKWIRGDQYDHSFLAELWPEFYRAAWRLVTAVTGSPALLVQTRPVRTIPATYLKVLRLVHELPC
jgi:hypothetical protein